MDEEPKGSEKRGRAPPSLRRMAAASSLQPVMEDLEAIMRTSRKTAKPIFELASTRPEDLSEVTASRTHLIYKEL